MNKHIDSEKLIAEIKQELSAHDKVYHLEAQEVGKAWSRGHRRALEEMLDFITSLQQEQQEGRARIKEQKGGCFYCVYFNGCHTTVWRKGQTCDLFVGK